MTTICPKCGWIATWNSHFGSYLCERCDWQGMLKKRKEFTEQEEAQMLLEAFREAGVEVELRSADSPSRIVMLKMGEKEIELCPENANKIFDRMMSYGEF
ncbi:MAG TPA: hypothetical protein DCW90_05335 [Lachnospiraceae bacterium]|nr:hypothetical protein [Lachnospiraceae bacterium]